jgi:hypothetical protein
VYQQEGIAWELALSQPQCRLAHERLVALRARGRHRFGALARMVSGFTRPLRASCFTHFELSWQSAFHQSLTLLVHYRSRVGI